MDAPDPTPDQDPAPASVKRQNGEFELAGQDEAQEQRDESEDLEEHRKQATAPTDTGATRPVPAPEP